MPSSANVALAVNTLRFLAVDAVEAANSGHPGMPMGAAPMATALWTRFLKFDPALPDWPDRDRFVLSAGHGSMLLYGLLHLAGYGVSLDDLKAFRQWGSATPGHPEYGHTPGVETTTGPLGQGISAAVGMALAERHLAGRFNRPSHEIVDHYTYVVAGDGDLMEGVSAEAASLAGHLKLGRLVVLYDDNHITIEGSTELAFTEDPTARYEAYGWHVQGVDDGTDLDAVAAALEAARAETDRPSLVRVRTHIGHGSPNKQDTASAHGAPLGAEETGFTKANLGWPARPAFHVPEGATAPFAKAARRGADTREAWLVRFTAYEEAHPALAEEFKRRMGGALPKGWEGAVPVFAPDPKGTATRGAGGEVLNALAGVLPELVGGSADLAPSTKTWLEGEGTFSPDSPRGRNLHFGVREHAMASIMNGMANHGGVRPFGSTFFVFADYLRPGLRLAALMGLPVVHVFTHDSIFVGEDGPTHQPVEHLASLRAMPGLDVIRPCDANESAEAWKAAMENRGGPTALVLTRQNLPVLDRTVYAPAAGLHRGGYILREAAGGADNVNLILIGTGSEVHLALGAAEILEKDGVGVRVVSFPSWKRFDAQNEAYRDEVLPPALTARVSVEAASPFGWERYVGSAGRIVGIDHFGASAPAGVLAEKFGITVDAVVEAARGVLAG